MSSAYRPFIDDPNHLRLLERQRYVVLRAIGSVRAAYVETQRLVSRQLAGASLNATSWAAASESFGTLSVPIAKAAALEAESVAYDAGRESSGGVVPFGGPD